MPGQEDPHPALRVTRRCLFDDLGADEEAAASALAELARIVAGEPAAVNGRPPGMVVHRSRVDGRGLVTWPDDHHGLLWLVAVVPGPEPGVAGQVGDARDAGRLLPTRDDYVAFFRSGPARDRARALTDVAGRLRAEARAQPGVIQEGVVGARIALRVLCEEARKDHESCVLWVGARPARPQHENGLQVGMILACLGAVFRGARFDACLRATAIGTSPLLDDEVAYCHMRGDAVARASLG